MVRLAELVQYCDTLLEVETYQDYCPNGLQVEGSSEVKRIVGGVTASQALIDRAVELEADALLVHHGYFWKGEAAPITGMKQRRIKTLLQNDISLIAYHLPLDGHALYGNNAQLASLWGLEVDGRFGAGPSGGLGMSATLPEAITLEQLAARLERSLEREPLVIPGGDGEIKRLGWCSGAAQGMIEQAAAEGLDAFVSGEVSEPTVHTARELGIHYIAAGHHATERYGIQAFTKHLSEYFSLENYFVDVPNPV